MKIVDGKIAEATRDAMFDYYLTRGFDDVMSFAEFLRGCKENGTRITDKIEDSTISEIVNKQTPLGIICMLRACADDIRAPGPYPSVRNIKPIDCDKLYEFMNAIADKIECWLGPTKEATSEE